MFSFITIIESCTDSGGLSYFRYMQELHETKLWFSHIEQVEQEISMRTEAGLYYSYYKFAVHPRISFDNTIYALMHDNR